MILQQELLARRARRIVKGRSSDKDGENLGRGTAGSELEPSMDCSMESRPSFFARR